MKASCVTFTNACSICAGVRSRTMVKAPVVPVPTPDKPFEVIHVDHKGPLPRSDKYTNRFFWSMQSFFVPCAAQQTQRSR